MVIRRSLPFAICAVATLVVGCSGGGSGGAGSGISSSPDVTDSPNLGAALGTPDEFASASQNTMEIAVPAQFDWSSNGEVSLNLQLLDGDGLAAPRTGVSVYAMPDAAMADGLREPFDNELDNVAELFTGVSDEQGHINTVMQVPGHVISAGHVFVRTRLMGVSANAVVSLSETDSNMAVADWTFGPVGMADERLDTVDPHVLPVDSEFDLSTRNATQGNFYLQPPGSFYHGFYGHIPAIRTSGRCDVTETNAGQLCRSAFSKAEIQRLGQIITEGKTPAEKYTNADSSLSNLVFNKKANVIVSFLLDGAGYRNTFGFFSFDSSAPPTNHLDLTSARILFPNTSFRGSGGYMFPGDAVSLGEIDPAAGNDSIGFYLAANGWPNGFGKGTPGQHFYSLSELNPESEPDQRKHMLLISNTVDEETNTRRLWVAVEDIRLDEGSDRDYNDLVMMVDVYPADAMTFGAQIPDITEEDNTKVDADNDGILATDDLDDNDPDRAFERYYPGENIWGTLLAEDNWPALGDFDMNDMVVRYRVREVYNSDKQVKDVDIDYRLEARGAAFHNGFGVSLGDNVFADNVMSATLNGENIQTVNDASALVYRVFEDAWAYTFEGDADCWTYNTLSDCPTHETTEFNLSLTFANAVERDNMLSPPYNPFLFAHKIDPELAGYTRVTAFNNELYHDGGAVHDLEIHLPNHAPTQGQDVNLFGTGDDASDGVERFYVSSENLPWIIDVPDLVKYPEEFSDISEAYPEFSAWVTSGGTESRDWYRNPSADEESIYQTSE